MNKILDKLSLWLAGVGAVAVMIAMITMVGDAIARKVIGTIPGAYETSLSLMVLINFLPQAFVQMRRAHIAVDFLSIRLSSRTQGIVAVTSALLAAAAFALLFYLSALKAWDSTVSREEWRGLIVYPVWPLRWFVLLGFGVFIMQLVSTSIQEFRKLLKKG
jgi:TRAP-type mannitol/chloroaromatic compound transport system permease small subunit